MVADTRRTVATAAELNWRSAWPGFCATLISLGLGRFAYTALIPFLIAAEIVSAVEAAYAGAANLGGYLIGALAAPAIGRRVGSDAAIRIAFVGSVASLVACAMPFGYAWLMAWRLVIGVTGAMLMILAPSLVVGLTAPAERGRAGGLVYTGVGFGTLLASAIIVPIAATVTLTAAWTALAFVGAAATAVTWRRWRQLSSMRSVAAVTAKLPATAASTSARLRLSAAVAGLPLAALLTIAATGMDGAGFVPHTIFWVDYVARALGMGAAAGALNWALFGLGALAGPLLAGALGDRIGIAHAAVLAFGCKAVAVLLPVLTSAPAALALSSIVVGALSPGIMSLVGSRLSELIAPAQLARAWSFATVSFALGQAAGAYGMSFALAHTGAYLPLYVAGAVCEMFGMVLCLAAIAASPRRRMAMG